MLLMVRLSRVNFFFMSVRECFVLSILQLYGGFHHNRNEARVNVFNGLVVVFCSGE